MVSNEERIRVIHWRYTALLASASLILTVARCGLFPVDEATEAAPAEEAAADHNRPAATNGLRIAHSEQRRQYNNAKCCSKAATRPCFPSTSATTWTS
ncbi:MAG: hypothetical protein ACQETK_10925 [Pseudomonadota bacterium]